MQDLTYSEAKSIFKDYTAPYNFIFLDALDRNIALTKKRSGEKEIRVASKSVRSLDVLKYLKEKLGDKFSGLMTYHIDESIHLLKNGFDSALMGYPQTIGHAQGSEIKELAAKNKFLISMVDSIEQVKAINKLGEEIDHQFKVCIDIDLSLSLPGLNFGVFRSPLRKLEDNKKLFEKIQTFKNVKCVGVMGYEAQIAGVGDSLGKGRVFDFVVSILKYFSVSKIYKYRGEVVDLAKSMFDLEFVNGGGTGSLTMTAKDKSVTEVTAGSAFYCPHLFDRYDEHFEPSCGYTVQVSRKPSDSIVTCHGGGYVASGACGTDKIPSVFLPKGLKFDKNEMFGEVQTPLHKEGKIDLDLGDPVFLRHAKAGEVMERFNEILVVKDKKVFEKWKTYRGDSLCYL